MSDETSPPTVNTTLPMGESEAIDVTVTNGSNGQIESRFSSWWALRFKGATAPWSMNFASTVGVSYVMVNDTAGIATLNARSTSLGSITLAVGEVALVIALTDPATNTVEFRKISSNPAAAVTFAAVKAALAAATSNVGFNGFQVNGLADGNSGDAAATVRQTYYSPYAAPAGPGTVLPAIVGQNYMMGGTVASPTQPAKIIQIWPRNPAQGPWDIATGTSIFSTTQDPTMGVGYNIFGDNVAEPHQLLGFEADYENPPGTFTMETYFHFASAGGLTTVRPFFSNFNRITFDCSTAMEFSAPVDLGARWYVTSRFNGDAVEVNNQHFRALRDEFSVLTQAGVAMFDMTSVGSINCRLAVELYNPQLTFRDTVVAPYLGQDSKAAAGQTLAVKAQTSTGAAGGDLYLESGVGATRSGYLVFTTGNDIRGFFDPIGGNFEVFNNSPDFGGGVGVMSIGRATTAPAGSPTANVLLYVDPADGALKAKFSTGAVRVIASP